MSAPPPRLLDDPALDEELRQGLQEAQQEAVPYDTAAGLEALKAQTAATSGAATTSATAGSAKLWLVLGSGVLAAGAITALAVSSSRDAEPAEPNPVVAPSLSAPPEPAPPAASTSAAVVSSATPVPTPSQTSAASAPKAPASSAPPPLDRKALLAAEVRHLASVRQLTGGSPAAAARKADEGHRLFPRGMLYQEREALAISSLARAGQGAQARARATQFLSRFPKSPFAEQVKNSAGIPSEKK